MYTGQIQPAWRDVEARAVDALRAYHRLKKTVADIMWPSLGRPDSPGPSRQAEAGSSSNPPRNRPSSRTSAPQTPSMTLNQLLGMLAGVRMIRERDSSSSVCSCNSNRCLAHLPARSRDRPSNSRRQV
jgi:hypothetical protein